VNKDATETMSLDLQQASITPVPFDVVMEVLDEWVPPDHQEAAIIDLAVAPKDSTAIMKVQQLSYVNPDDVPSCSNDEIATPVPKLTDSDLCQSMYQSLMFLHAFPNMKPLMHPLVEFLTISTMDTVIHNDPIQAVDMLVGSFTALFPVFQFKGIVNSHNLFLKLAAKGGLKKKKPKLFGDELSFSSQWEKCQKVQ
jgi:hypothetical protein